MTFAKRITERQEQRAAEKAANLQALATIPARALHRGVHAGAASGNPVEKENAIQHSGYMAAVRALGYCMLCKRACHPQFCHADQGKGERIKTDVRRGWPGCGPSEGGPGCHYLVGTSGQFTKEQRRALEADLGRRTRAAIRAAGTWPARLPLWKEDAC